MARPALLAVKLKLPADWKLILADEVQIQAWKSPEEKPKTKSHHVHLTDSIPRRLSLAGSKLSNRAPESRREQVTQSDPTRAFHTACAVARLAQMPMTFGGSGFTVVDHHQTCNLQARQTNQSGVFICMID